MKVKRIYEGIVSLFLYSRIRNQVVAYNWTVIYNKQTNQTTNKNQTTKQKKRRKCKFVVVEKNQRLLSYQGNSKRRVSVPVNSRPKEN